MARSGKSNFWKDNDLTLAVMGLFIFSWLGQKDSAQSKPVDAPHSKTEEGAKKAALVRRLS